LPAAASCAKVGSGIGVALEEGDALAAEVAVGVLVGVALDAGDAIVVLGDALGDDAAGVHAAASRTRTTGITRYMGESMHL
jgi:hypothetical protein